jgi:fructuronate reductase
MRRLSNNALALLPGDVARPAYDRAAIVTGVVHLGIGAFHRAHQAVVFDEALANGDTRWGVIGASLRAPDVREQLKPQDGLYTLRVREGENTRDRVVGAVRDVLVARENPSDLVTAMTQPSVQLVTLTITEKGYLIDPASGALMDDDPNVANDIEHPTSPCTALGFLTGALAARRNAGTTPFTIISCDNLPHNGARTRAAVLAMARLQDQDLAAWIEDNTRFPATMVDRIVPATTEADIEALAQRLGIEDRGMVKAEPFTQWVLEDKFAGARPDFEAFGVQLTKNVAPWENAKLRLLNGAHSALAYLGALAGHDFVAEAVAAPGFRTFVGALWDEAETGLTLPPELDVEAYRAALLARFTNSALEHRTRQIAMDGSQKLPQRLLASVRSRLAAGLPFPALALAVAGWMRWQFGRDEAGVAYHVDDPLAARTAALVRHGPSASARVDALLSLDAVFGEDLPRDARFRDAVSAALDALLKHGAARTVAAFARGGVQT